MASAVGGNGGDKWGAFGGSAVQPSAPQNLDQALSIGQRQTNYETAAPPPNTLDILSEMSRGRLSRNSRNGDLIEGRSTVGNPVVNKITSPPVGPNCTLLGSTAVPGFAIPGCMIPGVNFQ